MDFRVASLSREVARQKGLVIIDPDLADQTVLLEEKEYVLVELRNLSTHEDYSYWYGIVATSKATGESKIILEAACYNDGRGHYFAFPSELLVKRAIEKGKAWVNKGLKRRYGVDPSLHPERFKLSFKRKEKAVADLFVQWLANKQGWQICEREENGFQPVKANHEHLVAMFLGIDYEGLMKENADALVRAVASNQALKQTKSPPPKKDNSWLFKKRDKKQAPL